MSREIRATMSLSKIKKHGIQISIVSFFISLKKEETQKRCRRLSNDVIFVTDARVTRERNRFVFSREFTSKGQTLPGTIYQETGIPEGTLKKGGGSRKKE